MRHSAILVGTLIYIGLTIVGAMAKGKAKPETAEQSPPSIVVPSEEIRLGGIIVAIDPARHKVLIQQYKVNQLGIGRLSGSQNWFFFRIIYLVGYLLTDGQTDTPK